MKKIFLSAIAAICSLGLFAQTRIDKAQTAEEKLNEQYCTGLFKSAEGVILDLENTYNAVAYFNILDWLDGRVAGLKVYKTRNDIRIPFIRGQQSSIYVDEQQVSASHLNFLSTGDIVMIKVIRSPFLGGFNGAGGAIAIYTYGIEPEEDESK